MARAFRPSITVGGSAAGRYRPGAAAGWAQNAFRESMKDLLDNLHDFINHLEGATPDILADVLEPTFGKAIEYCPKDTGELVDSAFLEVERFRGGSRAVMGFGRGNSPAYAIFVHEMPYAHEAPTRSKFLQAAIDEDYYSILNALPARIREVAGT